MRTVNEIASRIGHRRDSLERVSSLYSHGSMGLHGRKGIVAMDAIVEEPEPECEFDGPWKEAIEWFFEPFLEFFFPEVYENIDVERGHEFLD